MNFQTLLAAHQANNRTRDPQKISFAGVDGLDVYNITAPFSDQGRTFIAGRVEARNSEDSHVVFFERQDDTHYRPSEYPVLHLQDPFFAHIGGKLIIGGVHVTPRDDGTMSWQTDFYRGIDLGHLEFWLAGPAQMKDIRLGELPDGRVLALTRPQGELGKLGKIGGVIVDQLDELSSEVLAGAPLLKNNFADENWGGPNQVLATSANEAVVLGHMARRKEDQTLQYTAMLFTLDLLEMAITEAEMIATRADLLAGPAKRPDLTDVIFSGGYDADGHRLYVGTSDAEAQSVEVSLKGKI